MNTAVTESPSKYTADDVLSAFKDANLSVIDPRDNTSKQCKSDGLNCTQLITTEDVSIYLWPSEELAGKNASSFSHQSGAFTIRFNKPQSPEDEYIKAIDALINS
ncbi:hypothetical protein [Peribacillus frigoritolerans]|uniref:hypothetical protein n=1 Tax=Peribacillus frigoritolerans TaxID=450367 RepID=UPI00105A65B5|nr:hypothetical protein [Peribacillus frigoritolerans]TDL82090.1 hypothetical protein E2R53_00430 [Peribacillus frigoritolerans]